MLPSLFCGTVRTLYLIRWPFFTETDITWIKNENEIFKFIKQDYETIQGMQYHVVCYKIFSEQCQIEYKSVSITIE